MKHFVEVCKFCDSVISQCRCPSSDKEKRLGVCDKCVTKEAVLTCLHCLKSFKTSAHPVIDIWRSFYCSEKCRDSGVFEKERV